MTWMSLSGHPCSALTTTDFYHRPCNLRTNPCPPIDCYVGTHTTRQKAIFKPITLVSHFLCRELASWQPSIKRPESAGSEVALLFCRSCVFFALQLCGDQVVFLLSHQFALSTVQDGPTRHSGGIESMVCAPLKERHGFPPYIFRLSDGWSPHCNLPILAIRLGVTLP